MTRPEVPARGAAGPPAARSCEGATRPRTWACSPRRGEPVSPAGGGIRRDDTALAWELLYRLEPELYDRLASAERLHPEVLGWLPRGLDRIAEVGAGTGRLTMELVERGRHVVAVEPALPLRRILRRKLTAAGHGDRVRVVGGFFDELPLPDDLADLVVACSAFTPAPGHGGEAGLAEMERVCRPGGCVAIIWPNHLGWLDRPRLPACQLPRPDVCRVRQLLTRPWSWPRSSTQGGRRGAATRLAQGSFEALGINPPRDVAFKALARMKVAIIAPLVTAICEPQRGGSQAFLCDLARGLADRGNDVEVYAAFGSALPGVNVIDTGIDPRCLAGHALRASGPSAAGAMAPRGRSHVSTRPSGRPGTTSSTIMPSTPCRRARDGARAPVVHTLHLPPDSWSPRFARRPRAVRLRRGRVSGIRRALGAGSSQSMRSCPRIPTR